MIEGLIQWSLLASLAAMYTKMNSKIFVLLTGSSYQFRSWIPSFDVESGEQNSYCEGRPDNDCFNISLKNFGNIGGKSLLVSFF